MYNLVGIDETKRFLKIKSQEDDEILTDLIEAASRQVEQYCSKRFITREITEYYDGNKKRYLLTNYYPVYSITTLHDDTGHDYDSTYLIATDDYRIYYDDGRIMLTSSEYRFADGQQNVKVVYKTGYSRFNVVDEQNSYIDIVEAGSEYATEVTAHTLVNTAYPGYSAEDLITTLETALDANTDLTGAFTVTYNHNTQKFTIASDTSFTIKWGDGTNKNKSLAMLMGFSRRNSSAGTSHEAEYAATGLPRDLRFAVNGVLSFMWDDTKEGRGLARTSKESMPSGQGLVEYINDLPRNVKRILDSYSRVLL